MTNIVANRGMHIPFRIVKDIPEDPSALPDRAAPYKRVLDQRTADQLKWLMTEVVRRGTGVPAQLDGFQAAGKTGTAQKYLPGKGYSRAAHIGSFVGFVPADDPVISMIVVIDNPRRKFYGAEVAAPVFRDIAERVLLYLRVRRDPGLKRTLLTADSRRENR
jgi:cell division protein FtsI (penicillin-binding protein 3)